MEILESITSLFTFYIWAKDSFLMLVRIQSIQITFSFYQISFSNNFSS